MTDIAITQLKTAKPTDVQAIGALVTQLSSTEPGFSLGNLKAMLADPSTTIFVARANEEIVGMTTLVIFRVATGLRAFIDDVVVMTTHQKRRLGERLVRAAINHATSHGIEKIDLTSRPSRETANRLYQRMGFERRETNVYRLKLKAGVVSPEP
ncbi:MULTISPECIES: GNAT family N-acetyltransferase [Thalassospira]|uniref:N-acetyltransferase GCN5 n=1 Tax=Thalassospira xiamenensis M-5 = DSM 17429 TaxID=1123366 RepID=A0AB72UFK9_9PROT|nr:MULTISPECIES: GNAT family N-acetyltransferase [Thalassospira]AJD52982.1 N-acetyltransferase GCN5 [Thalassospira xiamenensis M-5 = DSM 17429]MCD1594454.1 GNAT family N-acetyltransferase [Thalassospira xiamenensis]MDM7978174.1 GNAT family N-acetyltransferase [Thalassospira xiamenensis]SIT19856.1 Ribosomal protein S18 acetylase RimI [Thalassospira xiamenensis M-5 = DSM 17429]